MDLVSYRQYLINRCIDEDYSLALRDEIKNYLVDRETIKEKFGYSADERLLDGQFMVIIEELCFDRIQIRIFRTNNKPYGVSSSEWFIDLDVNNFVNNKLFEEDLRTGAINKITKRMDEIVIEYADLLEQKERLENGLGLC